MVTQIFSVFVLLAVASPLAMADDCKTSETALLVRGDGFEAIPLQIRPGVVRIGAIDFNYIGDEVGWRSSRPGDSSTAGALPATQITVDQGTLEVRSLDRRPAGGSKDSPDAVVTAVVGDNGTEIHIKARGAATLEVGSHPLPNSKELSIGCDGTKALSASLLVL
jgi:hypothetical protein